MKEHEDKDPFDNLPAIEGYRRPDEAAVENLPAEWQEEDRIIEGRTPDLGETEEDNSEI